MAQRKQLNTADGLTHERVRHRGECEHFPHEALHNAHEEHHDIDVVDVIHLEVVTAVTMNTSKIMLPHKQVADVEGVVTRRNHVEPVQMFMPHARFEELGQDARRVFSP